MAQLEGEPSKAVVAPPATLDPQDRLARPLKFLVAVALTVLLIACRSLPPILRRTPDPLDLEEPIEDRPVRIMLLGDSITQGCCDGLHLGYRYFLWEELKRNGHGGHFEFIGTQLNLRNPRANDTVGADIKHLYPKYDEFIAEARMHEARSGAMIRDVWGPIEELLFKMRPDVVVVLLGINDLMRTKYDPRRIQRSQKDMADFPDKMLKYSPHGTMIMCSLVPTRTPPPDFTKFNQMILAVTDKWGLPYVDLAMGYDPFKDNSDEIHPDWSGERKIAERVYDAIIPFLPPPNTMDDIGNNDAEVGS